MKPIRVLTLAMLAALTLVVNAHAADPLPSWNDGPAKQTIIEFVTKTIMDATFLGDPALVDPVVPLQRGNGHVISECPMGGRGSLTLTQGPNASSKAFASCKSWVSNPSVNQL